MKWYMFKHRMQSPDGIKWIPYTYIFRFYAETNRQFFIDSDGPESVTEIEVIERTETL